MTTSPAVAPEGLPRLTWRQAIARDLRTKGQLAKRRRLPVRPPVALVVIDGREFELYRDRDTIDLEAERWRSIRWADAMLRSNAVILDTETTGTDPNTDRAVQIGVVDMRGDVLLDTLVDPGVPIPADASAIHGYHDRDVAGQPAFGEILPQLSTVLTAPDRPVIVYNSRYDGRLLRAEVARVRSLDYAMAWSRGFSWKCAMTVYGWFRGQWDERRGDWRRHALPGGDHNAVGDCRAVLRLIETMAEAVDDPPLDPDALDD
ncbi:3'-5' exonuclease [Microtetraspora malaysiensis]|uniref:3'-5' exonuclease n=1 Tax=Microtetraspora malaysiensis TaxID=161358 RepID=UPI003D8E4ACE